MGLFRKKKREWTDVPEQVRWRAGQVQMTLPPLYKYRFLEEARDERSTFRHRMDKIRAAIEKIEQASTETEGLDAAVAVMPSPSDARRFHADARAGRGSMLLGQAILESHRRIFAELVAEAASNKGIAPPDCFLDAADHARVQAKCLAEARPALPDDAWSGMVSTMSTMGDNAGIFAEALSKA